MESIYHLHTYIHTILITSIGFVEGGFVEGGLGEITGIS